MSKREIRIDYRQLRNKVKQDAQDKPLRHERSDSYRRGRPTETKVVG